MVDLGESFKRARSAIKIWSGKETSRPVTEPPPWSNIIEMFDYCPILNLTPQQRFIYKMIYGLELDDSNPTIPIYDQFKETISAWLTERGFCEYLVENNLTNQTSPDGHVGKNFTQVVLPIGRRGSKSFLTGGIYAYELSQLLRHYDPHSYYNIIPGEIIGLRTVATKKSQAAIIFQYARAVISNTEWFEPYFLKDLTNFLGFRTAYELDQIASGNARSASKEGSVQIEFIACLGQKARGFGNRILAMDEIAHFVVETNSATSDKKVLDALEPSLATYKTPQDELDSKLLLISNPLGEDGVFYHRYLRSFEDRDNYLMIQLPSWLANPTKITSQTLKQSYDEDPDVYWAEFGAKFSANVLQFAKREWLSACFSEDPTEFEKRDLGLRGIWHYMGIDLGYVDDHTTFTIVHLDQDGNVVLDYHEDWDPKDHGGAINAEDIQNHIRNLCSKFYIRRGMLDQFNGWVMTDDLHNMGFRQFENVSITGKLKREMFDMCRDYLRNAKILGYWDHTLCSQLQQLRMLVKSNYEFSIYKPRGTKDDSVDSFVRAVWLARDEDTGRGREFRTDDQRVRRNQMRRAREMNRGNRMIRTGNRWRRT